MSKNILEVLFKPDCKIKRVFICGKITGDPDYRTKFNRAADALEKAGYAVMNPAILPSTGFEHDQYMTVTLAMLSVCDAFFYLNDWVDSPGAIEEMEKATQGKKLGFSFEMWQSEHNRRAES